MPVAAVALILSIVLLVRSKKRDGVRPPRAHSYRLVALFFILFAAVVFVVIPFIYFLYLISKFGLAFIYAGAKSVG